MAFNLPNIPNLPISPLALVHLILTGFVLVYQWLPTSYLFSHVTLILIILWAAYDRQCGFAVVMYLIGLFMTFLLDLIVIGFYYNRFDRFTLNTDNRGIWQFSVAMAIIHLLAKPLLGLFALTIVLARRDSLKVTNNSGYSNIEGGSGGEN